MIPPTTTGTSTPSSRSRRDDLGDQLEVRAGEDREADDVDVLLEGRLGDLLGGQADALVDRPPCPTSRARTRSARSRWSGRRARACRRGSGSGARARARDLVDPVADLGELVAVGGGGGAVDAGRAAVGAEDLAQRRRPLAGGGAGLGGLDRRRHHVLVLGRGDPGELLERRSHGRPRRARPSTPRAPRPARARPRGRG